MYDKDTYDQYYKDYCEFIGKKVRVYSQRNMYICCIIAGLMYICAFFLGVAKIFVEISFLESNIITKYIFKYFLNLDNIIFII